MISAHKELLDIMKTKDIPFVSISQMREVDRLMVEEIGVSTAMMMENASRNIAVLARILLGGNVKNKKITILCGKGNNGGDGLGAVRHLINYGADCTIILAASPSELRGDPRSQYDILLKYPAKILQATEKNIERIANFLNQSDLIIDALLGYSLKGNPKEPIATLIRLANKSGKHILAVDIPSGLDGDTGEVHDPTVKADVTLTLALPKVGLLGKKAKKYEGKLYLADLSVPKIVYSKLGIDTPLIFEKQEIIPLF